MKKRISLLLSLALIASAVTGFGVGSNSFVYAGITDDAIKTKVIPANEYAPNPAKERPGAENTLSVLIYGLGEKFLPIYSTTDEEKQVGNLIFDSLYTNDEKGVCNVPELASSYEYSKDHKILTFHLKKKVKWSDGKPFTAKDVENTLMLLSDDQYTDRLDYIPFWISGYQSFNRGDTNKINGIKVLDDYTIRITFNEVLVNNFANIASFPILPAHIYPYARGKSEKLESLQDQMVLVGSGRYMLEAYDPNGLLKLKANPNWHGGKVNVPNIEITFESDYDIYDNFEMGNVDLVPYTTASNSYVDRIDEIGCITINQYATNNLSYIGLNLRDKRLAELSVRQALAYGFNKQYFIDNIYDGYGKTSCGPVIETSWAFTNDMNAYQYNPQKANQILDKAGWKKGKDGIRSKNGQKLSFVWDTYSDSNYAETLTTFIKSDWSKIGVSIKPHVMEFNELVNKVYTKRTFDIYEMAWSMATGPLESEIFHSSNDYPGGNNSVGFRNKEADRLMDAIDKEFDKKKATEYIHQYAKIINQQLPYIFVGYSSYWDLTNSRVKNYRVSPFCDWTYHIEDVELEQ